jgi:hypothetical protein
MEEERSRRKKLTRLPSLCEHSLEKGKIEEVLCGSACYPFKKVLLDALSDQMTRAVCLKRERETSDR